MQCAERTQCTMMIGACECERSEAHCARAHVPENSPNPDAFNACLRMRCVATGRRGSGDRSATLHSDMGKTNMCE